MWNNITLSVCISFLRIQHYSLIGLRVYSHLPPVGGGVAHGFGVLTGIKAKKSDTDDEEEES